MDVFERPRDEAGVERSKCKAVLSFLFFVDSFINVCMCIVKKKKKNI